MKKIIVAITLALCAFGAYAAGGEQVATSQAYVSEELATKQDKFNKLGTDTAMTYSGSTDGVVGTRTISGNLGAETNTSDTAIPTVDAVNTKLADQQDILNLPSGTVLRNTGKAGVPGTKGIYDGSGDYNPQNDALIDAATLNAAVQTAINSEFVCVERKIPGDDTSPCYLFEIVTTTPNLIIPAEYTRLEYLESTGRQAINTQIYASNNIGVSVKYAFTEFGSYDDIFGSFNPHYYLGINSSGSGLVASYGPTSGNTVISMPITDVVLRKPYELNINLYNSGMAEFVGINSVKLAPKSFSSDNKIIMFGAWNGGITHLVKARIYYMKMTDGTTLVRDFIPAKRNSDGVLGMYDRVTNTFFTNAGSGTFIAGPEISSNIYLPME